MTQQQLSQAAELLQRGILGQAHALLGDLLKREPNNADALSLLGIAYAKEGNFSAASDVLQRAVHAAPSHAGAYMNFGGVLKRLGRLEEAAACFERVASLRPEAPVPALKQLGGILIDLRRDEEAVACFSRVLALQPQDTAALNDRGLALLDLGRFEAALADFEAALRLSPRFTGALANKGLALAKLGRGDDALSACDEAIKIELSSGALLRTKGHVYLSGKQYTLALECFDRAIALGQQDATTWALRGEALKALGQQSGASASFAQALSIDPTHWEALIAFGMCLIETSRFEEAAEAFTRAATVRPNDPIAYMGRCRAARELQNLKAALYDAERAAELAPDDVEALSLLMRMRRDLGQRAEALEVCDRALVLAPDDSYLHGNRGVLLEELLRAEEAITSYERAFELDPRNWIALQNLGGVLVQVGQGDDALARCDAKLQEAPHDYELWTTKGTILQALHRFDEAVAAFDRAIAERPNYPVARFYRSLALLTRGELEQGFKEYEWRRLGETPLLKYLQLGLPEPQKLDEVSGKRLVLHREQGLGDVIQFARFARGFADRGAKVSIMSYPPLVSLLTSLGNDITIVTDAAAAEADYALPLMSAPVLLGTTRETLPAQVPYLSAPDGLVSTWRDRLRDARGLRVGLCWSGNPSHVNDWARSIAFEKLGAVLGVPNVTYISVQKDVRATDESMLGESGVADFRTELTDLAETAALISALDLVITVDTSIAHLAGALGKPVWVLLATRVDWRWLAEGDTSAWYPTARLFRQEAPGAWEPVLGAVRSALEKLASGQ